MNISSTLTFPARLRADENIRKFGNVSLSMSSIIQILVLQRKSQYRLFKSRTFGHG